MKDVGWAVGGDFGWVGNNEGTILKTSDGGSNWVEQYNGTETFYSVDFVDANEGWAVGEDGIVRHTVNGGQTWPEQYSAGPDLKSVFFLN